MHEIMRENLAVARGVTWNMLCGSALAVLLGMWRLASVVVVFPVLIGLLLRNRSEAAFGWISFMWCLPKPESKACRG